MVLKNSYKSKSKTVTSRGYISIIIILLFLIIDRITKIWAFSTQTNKDYGIIAFTYVTNTGAGFSVMQNMNILLAIISIIALIVLIYYHNMVPKFSLIAIASGIIGNSIDRILYGGVIDFINLKFWPIFNIADSLIFIGVCYWIILLFKEENKNNKAYRNKNISKTQIGIKKKR
ncbi:MAG: signal peptidase II [Candidatus Woesearchaeota archaeon]